MASTGGRKRGEVPVEPPSAPEPPEEPRNIVSGNFIDPNFAYDTSNGYTTSTEGTDTSTERGDAPASVVESLPQPAVVRDDAGRRVTVDQVKTDDDQALFRAQRSAARALIAVNERLGEPTSEEIRKIAAEEDGEASTPPDRPGRKRSLAQLIRRG